MGLSLNFILQHRNLFKQVLHIGYMRLNDLLLKKEELPILYKNAFQIPIHPRLLDSSVHIDTGIAAGVFPQAADEWYEDLRKYTEQLDDGEEKEWMLDVFLKEEPRILKEDNKQFLRTWEDGVEHMENGLVGSFSISRNSGGTLYYNPSFHPSKDLVPLSGGRYIRFSSEKLKEFSISQRSDMMEIIVYSHHNIDHYPGALFLRNWAMLYMNEVFKQVF